MPVILEAITAPDAADEADLSLILADAPDGDTLPPHWRAQGWALWGGRFNGRLLALACCREGADAWWLEYLRVRDLTRRRGVARQLLALLAREARAQGRTLRVAADARGEALAALWQALGFERRADDDAACWQWEAL